MLIDHVIFLVAIFLKILKLTKLAVCLTRKEVKENHFFIHTNKFPSLHVWNDSPSHINYKNWAKNIILNANISFWITKNFYFKLWCIHFKRWKKYIWTRYLKRQCIYPNKVDSLLIRYFYSFFNVVTWPFF